MSDDRVGGELHAWIDPEIEVRVVAWILGEASEFEADALEQMLKERPELRVFKRRLDAVHYLMSEAVKSGDCEKWRLTPERRVEVLEALGIEPVEDVVVLPVDGGREHRVRRSGVRVALMAAACLLISLVLAPFLLRKSEVYVESPTIVSYSASGRDVTVDADGGSAPNLFGEWVAADGSIAAGGDEFRVTRSSGGEGGGGVVTEKLAALKANIGSGGLLIEDEDSPMAGEDLGFSVVDQSGPTQRDDEKTRDGAWHGKTVSGSMPLAVAAKPVPAEPEIPMPEVGVPDQPSGGTWAVPGTKGAVVTNWDSDRPVDPGANPEDWKRGRVDIAGHTMSKGRVVRREVSPVVKEFDGFMDYDRGIATDRRDGSYLRYRSDSSVGYRWNERMGTVTGEQSQTRGYSDNGDGVVSLPNSNELLALQNQLVTERMAQTEARPVEVGEPVPEFENREKDLKVDLDKSVGSLTEILQTKLNLTENRLEKMGEVVNERRDMAVDKALESHDYIESKREYESAQAMLQSMKLQLSSKRISLKIPKNPITVHEEAKAKKKLGGFLGLGAPKYEASTVLQISPNTPDLDPFGGQMGRPMTGSNMTRQFFTTEFEVVEAEKTLDRVVDELGLEKKWGTNKAGAIRRLKDSVKTEQVRGTDLIEIKVEEKNAADAKLIADRVAKSYQKRRMAMEQDRAKKALASLDAELRDQEDVVEEKRKVLDTIVQAIGIPYVEGVRGSGEMGRSQEQIYELAERNLYELEKEKQQLEIQIKTLLGLKGKDRMKYAAGLQLPQNGVTALYEQYQEAAGEVSTLKATGMGAKHPEILRKKEEARRLAEQKKREALLKMEKSASAEAFSTFSLHVSDVSFKLAQAALAKGEWPEAGRIRVEEFVNAFDYGDPAPSQDQKVSCALGQAAHPFMQQRNMLRIAMRTAAVGRASGTPLRLTVLLDNSGSMERSDREESVKRAFQLLAAQMNPQDEVTLISFARKPRLLRDSVPGDKVGDLVQLIADTPSEGGTNLEEALRLGVEKAQEDFLEGAQNRIILLTDGAANLGNAEPELLGAMVEKMRQKGIAFDACGVGAEGLNDDVLEALTRKGDGRYYFLDRPEDADAGFAKQIAGALRPAAKNVKVQVEFNPKRVGYYRLYGFEKHELKKEDFRDDKVDAAEMAAEEAGVAMYQVETLPDGEGDVGSVSVRFMDMATGRMVEKRWTIPYEANPSALAGAASSMKLAASAAFLGEKLKGSPVGDLVELGDLSRMSRSLQPVYPASERVGQLIEMIEKVRGMAR